MAITWNDIVTQALHDLKVIPSGGTASTAELADALVRANTLLGSLSAQAIPIPYLTSSTVALSGLANYPLSTRPIKIEAATVVLSINAVRPVRIVPVEVWMAYEDKAATGNWAEILYYDAVFPSAQVWLAPKPTAGNLLLQAYMPLTQIVAWTDPFNLPPGYDRMMIQLLVLELADMFGATVTQTMMANAQDAKVSIQGLNAAVLGPPSPVVPMAPVAAPNPPAAAA